MDIGGSDLVISGIYSVFWLQMLWPDLFSSATEQRTLLICQSSLPFFGHSFKVGSSIYRYYIKGFCSLEFSKGNLFLSVLWSMEVSSKLISLCESWRKVVLWFQYQTISGDSESVDDGQKKLYNFSFTETKTDIWSANILNKDILLVHLVDMLELKSTKKDKINFNNFPSFQKIHHQ